MKTPQIIVAGIYAGKKEGEASIQLQKTISADSALPSLMSLSYRRKGDTRVPQGKDKILNFFLSMTQEAVDAGGFYKGVDINSLGHEGVYDIRERYTTALSYKNKPTEEVVGNSVITVMGAGGLDSEGNVVIIPVENPSTGDIMLSDGKLVFRYTELIQADEVSLLPLSDKKLDYDETLANFDGDKFSEGRRKTPEYQDFLNRAYAQFNLKTTPFVQDLTLAQ